MNKEILELDYLTSQIKQFGADRNWTQFHSPKNLSMALAVEASELMEVFQWLTESESEKLDEASKTNVALEVADIIMYALLICDRLEINMIDAIRQKLLINEERFPKHSPE